MFILRMKNGSPGSPGWVVLKTPIGDLFMAFVDEQDAQQYLAATGASAFCEPVAHEVLLQRDRHALAGVKRLLLLPSLAVAQSLVRDPRAFPYETCVVEAPDVR
jgi:hypothetical protein